MGMKERMFTGELYYPNEESIFDEQLKSSTCSMNSTPRALRSRRKGRN